MSVTRRHKLLFAIDSLHGGGAERVLCQLASSIDANRYEVHIALTLGLDQDYLPAEHVSIVPLPLRIPAAVVASLNPETRVLEQSWTRRFADALGVASTDEMRRESLQNDARAFRVMTAMLGRHIDAWRPDCILSFLPNSNMIALMARLWYRQKIPLICSDRNHLSSELPRLPWSDLRRAFIRRHYPSAEAHVAVSPEVATDLKESFGVPADRISTIFNGVDHEQLGFLAQAQCEFAMPPVAAGIPRLLAVGRLNRQKGFDILLQALARITQLPWHLTVLGDGEERAALQELSQQSGIADRIHFAGWQKNPYAWMSRSDIMVLSSRWEGMPNVLLEAMALAMPVVATDCPSGPRLLLNDGRAGKLVASESVESLASGLAEMLSLTAEQRRRLGALAARRSLDFSLARMVGDYQTLVDSAIAGSLPNRDAIGAG